LVGPYVAPAVQPAELGMAGEDQRRVFLPRVDRRAPALDLAGNGARRQGVDADLVEIAEAARLQLRRERRRDENLALLLLDEFADVGRPALDLLRAHARPLLEIVVGPDMDDAVQRPDLGMPEGGERRHPGARRQSLAETLLGGGDGARLQPVGAEFDDHRGFPPGVNSRRHASLFSAAAKSLRRRGGLKRRQSGDDGAVDEDALDPAPRPLAKGALGGNADL